MSEDRKPRRRPVAMVSMPEPVAALAPQPCAECAVKAARIVELQRALDTLQR